VDAHDTAHGRGDWHLARLDQGEPLFDVPPETNASLAKDEEIVARELGLRARAWDFFDNSSLGAEAVGDVAQ
jgi:hypothetical protein